MATSQVTIVRAQDRFVTRRDGVLTSHEFSFGPHYDPARTSFGPLVAHNLETVEPGHGYDRHEHRDVEIFSWVVAGSLRHDDDDGGPHIVPTWGVQRLHSGSGIAHTETNAYDVGDPAASSLTFVQLWFRLDDNNAIASYQSAEFEQADLHGTMLLLASSDPSAHPSVRLELAGVDIYAGLLSAGQKYTLPEGGRRHVHVVDGGVALSTGDEVSTGDSVHLTGDDPIELTAHDEAIIMVMTMSVSRR